MSLHRPAHVVVAFLWCLCGLAFLASEIYTIVHLVQTGEWQGVGVAFTISSGIFVVTYFLLVLICGVVMLAMPLAAMQQIRLLRAAATRDAQRTRESVYQPDRTLALRDGETLTFGRSRAMKQVLASWVKLTLAIVFALLFVEAFILSLLPSFWRNPHNPLYVWSGVASSPPPSFGDWFVALCQVAMMVVIWVIMSYALYRDHRETILVDDRGVTVRRSGRPTRAMTWSDLAVFLRTADATGKSPVGTYGLWGAHQGTWLEIYSQESAAEEKATRSRRTYAYEGGYSTYRQDAERMLATVIARSYQPLLVAAGKTTGKRKSRGRASAMRVALMTIEEVNALPLATARSADADASSNAESAGDVRLSPRHSRIGLALEALLIAAALFGVVFWMLGKAFDLRKSLPPELEPTTVTRIIVACYLAIGVICVLMGWAFARTRRHSMTPGVSADAAGLRGTSPPSSNEATIRWDDVTAWVVVPSPHGVQGSQWFVVCGADHKRIVWRESAALKLAGRRVRGDRRVAFQQRASELHALIAAKTALPLHEYAGDYDSARSQGSPSPVGEGDRG